MPKITKNKIIVIGAGYAGLRLVENLAKDKNNEILLLDKNPYHYMQTDVYDLIANEEDFAQITVDLFTFCMGFDDNVTFLKQEVLNIDFANKKVITSVDRINYDYLVVAVGARTKFLESVNGLKEYGHGIKALHRAMYFKQKFEMSLFKKVHESGTSCTPLSIIVAGAGLSGVEIAAQMASFAQEFYCDNNFICRRLNIILVNSSENILKGMDKKLVDISEKRLTDLGVIIKNEKRVVEVTEDSVILNDGEKLLMDFMIFTGGIEPNALVYKLDLAKNEKNFILTNESLQVKNHPEVFAIGDCTTIYNDSKPLVATADVAEQMSDVCSTNINNMINNKELIKHNIKSRGVLIALGRRYAAAKIFGFYLKGFFAFVMKKAIEKLYAKSLSIRSRKGCKKIFNS
jgi:NADH dehydrogenase